MKHLKLFVVLALVAAMPALSKPSRKPSRGLPLKEVCWQPAACMHYCEQRQSACEAATGNDVACAAFGEVCAEHCESGGCSSPF